MLRVPDVVYNAVLPGATNENVTVRAHTDAFFEGAMDNASGVATNVALAES